MNKLITVVAIIVLTIFAIIKFRQPSTSISKLEQNVYYSGVFSFKTYPLEKLGVAAKIMKKEVTHSDLISRSPVLRDLTLSKFKMVTQAVSKKIKGLTKSNKKPDVKVYMAKPDKNFEFDAKNSDFSLSFSDERPEGVLLEINDKKYNREQLPLNQVQFSQADTQMFEEKLRILADMYIKQLLLKVSKANNTTIQGFINKTILKTKIEVTDLELKAFAFSKGLKLDKNLVPRLRSIIKENKTKQSIDDYIAANYSKEQGNIYFYPPSLRIPLYENKALTDPQDSPSESPTFMVFSKLKCNGCSELADTISDIREKYKDKIRFGFVHFFSDNDWRSRLAAEASFCLNLQRNDAFWDFFNKISKTDKEVTETVILETAKSTGVNFENFKKCFVAQTYKKDVDSQLKYATDLGVTVSPTIIFDTNVLTGNIVKKQLENTIKASF